MSDFTIRPEPVYNMDIEQPIGTGQTADVFAVDSDRVLKQFKLTPVAF